ncbi:MAG: hypothetical protein CFR70_12065 [Rhodocyclaceae bacterium]|nr:MAG: hypothetical protein CFR70_12065 [Rhodocyclaceae bacterium]
MHSLIGGRATSPQNVCLVRALCVSLVLHLMLLQEFLSPFYFSSVANQNSAVLQVRLADKQFASNNDFESEGPSDREQTLFSEAVRESLENRASRSGSEKAIDCCVPAMPDTARKVQRTDPFSAYARVGLDPPPVPLADIQPDYPAQARGVEGVVTLRVLISERGVVDEVVVESSYPKGIFEESAVKAFREARFSPGKILGVPVKAQIVIEVDFSPVNRGNLISGGAY